MRYGANDMSRRAFLERQVARYQTQLDEMASFPDEPMPGGNSGVVIVFTKRFGATRSYDYTAVRAVDGRWYATGQERGGRTWEELMLFVASKENNMPVIQLASNWTVL